MNEYQLLEMNDPITHMVCWQIQREHFWYILSSLVHVVFVAFEAR